jgi:hypothetical protein
VPFEPPFSGGFRLLENPLPDAAPTGVTVLGDCNEDGRLDLLRPLERRLLVRQSDGSFETHPFEQWASSGAFVDVDGDGHLDLVLAGDAVRSFKGHGDCTFESTPSFEVQLGAGTTVSALRVQDVNLDGLDDFVLTMGGREVPPFAFLLAHGDGRYDVQKIEANGLVGSGTTGLPVFNTFLDDIDGDGRLDAFFLSDASTGWFNWGGTNVPVAMERDDRITDDLASRNPMGIAPLDYDRDGYVDYFLSGNGRGNLLYRNLGGRALSRVQDRARVGGQSPITIQAWSVCAFDADFDGWLDLLVLRLRGTPEDDGGEQPERPSFYINRRDGTFADVAGKAANVLTQSYRMACGDLFGNGKVSCYVDGFHGTSLLQNEIEATRPWAGLRLRGTVSGSSGAGARISVDGASPPQLYVAGSQAGTWTTHALDVLIAPPESGPTNVTITWPSGVVQHVAQLPSLRYTTITEPEIFQLSTRTAAADGTSTVDVELFPGLVGASEASVEVRGFANWQGPIQRTERGTWRRTLVAPSQASTVILELALDGRPLRVQPQVRFR